jgi:hypothetical protein
MKIICWILGLALLLLMGCWAPPDDVPENERGHPLGWVTFSNSIAYSISYPAEAKYRLDRSDGSVAFTTNSSAGLLRKTNDWFLSITELSSSCSKEVAEPKVLSNMDSTDAVWGRPPPFPCYVDACDDTQFGMSQYQGRYVLCSELSAKTVVIEINQITDNIVLAKQIFETFQWTE